MCQKIVKKRQAPDSVTAPDLEFASLTKEHEKAAWTKTDVIDSLAIKSTPARAPVMAVVTVQTLYLRQIRYTARLDCDEF